jgi:hypothetical protein
VVVHACSTLESEAEELQVQGQTELHSETLLQKNKNKDRREIRGVGSKGLLWLAVSEVLVYDQGDPLL